MEAVEDYRTKLAQRLYLLLGDGLLGLYQVGSACLGDYVPGKSDLDIVGVVRHPLSFEQGNELARGLDHSSFPCPAKGLDLVLFTAESAGSNVPEPTYEFWFATGASWHPENWETGRGTEMVIFLELCRRHGLTLFGPPPERLIASVAREYLLAAFQDMLEWHQTKVLDIFHDPRGQYSVLNACRVLAYVAEGQFLSKTAGGEWLLKQEPANAMVRQALTIRLGEANEDIDPDEITEFLQRTITLLHAHREAGE
ncbi:MAG: DUF4111 domain-containing protein [Lewinellaceae bacterium]|nr:DUF4111 domain-containing protein [Lewinellaceae bacterium]